MAEGKEEKRRAVFLTQGTVPIGEDGTINAPALFVWTAAGELVCTVDIKNPDLDAVERKIRELFADDPAEVAR